MFTKYCFIVNPAAGGGKRLACLSDIQAVCRANKIKFEITLTKAPKHATELARRAAARYEVVVAVGGDGTVNEVVNGLVGSQAALGILPIGSGNDFSREVGLTKDIKKDLTKLIHDRVMAVDVGCVNGAHYFINAFGVGFDGEVAARVRTFMRFSRGFPAYLLAVVRTLATFQFPELTLTIDRHAPIRKRVLFVSVANGTTYGGGFRVAPEAKIDDGFFTVCQVDKTGKWYALRQIPKFMKGRHLGLPAVHMFTGQTVVIEAEQPLQAQIDGELLPKQKKFVIAMLPRQLNVLVV